MNRLGLFPESDLVDKFLELYNSHNDTDLS